MKSVREFLFKHWRALPDGWLILASFIPLLALGVLSFTPAAKPYLAYCAAGLLIAHSLSLLAIWLRLKHYRQQQNQSHQQSAQAVAWAQNFVKDHLSGIRKPLKSLVGVKDVYDLNMSDPDTREYMEIVQHCSLHLIRHIDRLQLYSSLQTKSHDISPSRFGLEQLIDEAYQIAQSNNAGKTVALAKDYSPSVLKDFHGPYGLLRSLIVEIIDNAIRYSPVPKIRITAGPSKKERHNLVISVVDQGPGLAPDELSQIQKRLRLSTDLDEFRSSGSDMGFLIIRSLLQALGSEVQVFSKPGEGTKFDIHMRVPAYAHSDQANSKGSSNQILWSSKDPVALALTEINLKEFGYRAALANSQEDLFNKFKQRNYGLVLVDFDLPHPEDEDFNFEHFSKFVNSHPDQVQYLVGTSNVPSANHKNAFPSITNTDIETSPITKSKIHEILRKSSLQPHFSPNEFIQLDKFSGCLQELTTAQILTEPDGAVALESFLEDVDQNIDRLEASILTGNRSKFLANLKSFEEQLDLINAQTGKSLLKNMSAIEALRSNDFLNIYRDYRDYLWLVTSEIRRSLRLEKNLNQKSA